MIGRKNKQNKVNIKNRKPDEKAMAEDYRETSMTDEQFLLEIEEYAKKLIEDGADNEGEGTTNFDEDEHELEIHHLHQIIDHLKKNLTQKRPK